MNKNQEKARDWGQL